MRMLIALLVIVYLVGVGVKLAPTFQAKWRTATASQLLAGVAQELPSAAMWPATVYREMTGRSDAPAPAAKSQ